MERKVNFGKYRNRNGYQVKMFGSFSSSPRSKYFADSKYGGEKEASLAADQWMAEMNSIMNPAPRPEPIPSGVPYVTMARFFDKHNRIVRAYWKTWVPINKNERVQNNFPIHILGYRKAFRFALKSLRDLGYDVSTHMSPPEKPEWLKVG